MKMAIPMVDLTAQHESLKRDIEHALQTILESGHFILGSNVSLFEEEVAEYIGVRYAVGVASGTDALYLSLKALGIGHGDEVITTPFSFIAAAEAIAYTGAVPVFADIDSETFNLDPSKAEEKITARTKAILPVHLFGQPVEIDEILRLAGKHDLKVVEDCAQSFGAKYNGSMVGSFGQTGCFSFYPSKNLGACGDGGVITTNDPETSNMLKLLRNHGSESGYQHEYIGFNSRLDEIQAAILRIKLKHVARYNSERRKLAQLYSSLLCGVVHCPVEREDAFHVYHQYTIRNSRRKEVKEALGAKAISSVIYYPIPIHLQEAFGYLEYKKGDFPECEAASDEVLSLPIYPELGSDKVRVICDTILNVLKGK
jgi:dTDP-4-amino-4,6-dideoxygalactose transaminase